MTMAMVAQRTIFLVNEFKTGSSLAAPVQPTRQRMHDTPEKKWGHYLDGKFPGLSTLELVEQT